MSKRSVSTDALDTLGTIIGPNEKRDAIRLAVLPALAGKRLHPGTTVSIQNGVAMPDDNGLGIVDPFLDQPVKVDEWFWFILKPRLVQSLRHVWSHPAFPDEPTRGADQSEALAEIQRIAGEFDCEVDRLIAGAHAYLDHSDYLSEGDRWEGTYLPDEFWGTYLPDEFWDAFEIVTGRKVDSSSRGSFFSCSC